MFKLESYIAPILLSYVDKYIKNFKLEDYQVSLWGGEASFQNLDLRLEVLEEELQSPFSFISGHIRELLIHVPWTKLTSEPITITINTIECVLKIKEADTNNASESPSLNKDKIRRSSANKQEQEAPPNYVQLLINKIVSNIRIFCNNLILKYVEEDIVLSMNVKHLKFESCNEKWEAAYTDISPSQVVLRKLIGVNDLTICLDKRNSSGKIDVYQEPMLYRCSMTMHMLRTYRSATANKTSLTRLDVYCNNMEFSVTEQQVPMFIRLLLLLQALHRKELSNGNDGQDSGAPLSESRENDEKTDTWAGWAWSYLAAVLPTQDDEDSDESFLSQAGHIVQMGFYVDDASLTFKVSESCSDKGYYTQKKIRYIPIITLKLQGIYSEMTSIGIKWFTMSCGISETRLLPIGPCSCSHPEIYEDGEQSAYLKIGSPSTSHKNDSLFDVEALENKGLFRNYDTNWDFHLSINTENVLLERTPAVGFNYVYSLDIPDDTSSEMLSELGSNFEFSNFPERANVKLCIGALKFRICSGLFHRIDTVNVAASVYDYLPYSTPKAEPSLQELLPASEEDFDALNEFIPTRMVQLSLFEPVIELQLMDHPSFEPTKGNLIRKLKKHSAASSSGTKVQRLPKVTVECQFIDINCVNPMYMNRLVHTTCQLPEPPQKMFDACFAQFNVNVIGLCSRLVFTPSNYTMIVVPFNLNFQNKTILKPQYWIHSDIPHSQMTFESENLTLNGTKAKLMIVAHLIQSMISKNLKDLNYVTSNSLLFDAARDYGLPYLELSIESMKFRKVVTNSTVCFDGTVGSIKAFIFETLANLISDRDDSGRSATNIQQVLCLSGPETKQSDSSYSEDLPLLAVTFQYPVTPEIQAHPSLLVFNLQEIKICVDPLLCKWLLYKPIQIVPEKQDEVLSSKAKTYSDNYGSITESSKRISAHNMESVHSSSDREIVNLAQQLPKISEEESTDMQERIYDFLKTWYVVWKGMIFSGHISQSTIFFPTASVSALGSRGIEEAIREATNKGSLSEVMVITLPLANIQSAQKQNVFQSKKHLPVKLSEKVWALDKPSFPWIISVSDLNCYTIQSAKKFVFLKPVSLNATVGLSTKSGIADSKTALESTSDSLTNIGSLGVYVHIDMTPVIVSTFESQMYLFASIIHGLMDVLSGLMPDRQIQTKRQSEVLPPVITTNSPSISPTVRENTMDDTSDNTLPVSDVRSEPDSSGFKLTAWIQWTITKLSIELSSQDFAQTKHNGKSSHLKLVIDIEDIVNSLDYQKVYLKLKSKIGAISIQHFRRAPDKEKWVPGAFSGVIARLREDAPSEKRHEESGFICVTLTRASSQHTHNLWGALQKTKKDDKRSNAQQVPTRYITEIVINVQPIDLVLPPKTLINFYQIVMPLMNATSSRSPKEETPSKTLTWFNSQDLPLAYLECQDIRVIVPSSELVRSGIQHDVFIVQVGKISLSPSVVNPICRKPIRPDIYRQAAQARILNIPGSELEDRQYQFDIIGLCISTAKWDDLNHVLDMRNVERRVSENPAVEWNNLKQGQHSIIPILNIRQVADRFDISVIAAPIMVYKNETVICGSSFEINCVSDVTLYLSLDQIKLSMALINEFNYRYGVHQSDAQRTSLTVLYPTFDKYRNLNDDIEIELTEFYKDSGIDTSDIRSVLSTRSLPLTAATSTLVKDRKSLEFPKPSALAHYCEIPTEVLLTAGKITLSLYQVSVMQGSQVSHKGKKNNSEPEEDKNYEASEEESMDETNRTRPKYLPLFFLSLSQPNAYFSKQYLTNRTQISCFDLAIKLNSQESTTASLPTVENYDANLVETRSGNPHAVTGIPPAFFTLKYTKEYAKPATIQLELSRPTKIVYSASKLLYMMSLMAKLREHFILLSVVDESGSIEIDDTTIYRQLKNLLKGIDSINVKSDQLVFVMDTDGGVQACITLNKLQNDLSLCERPEKVRNFTALDCVTFSVISNQSTKVYLKPWSVAIEISAFLDSWQTSDSDPQIHVAIDSDCIMLEVGPEHLHNLDGIVKEMAECFSSLSTSKNSRQQTVVVPPPQEKDQHYKDDLRAGAFQVINATTSTSNELPLPYQIMFWNNDSISAMVWRYPQPRALTKIRVFPVPFDNTADFNSNQRVSCLLQYWSDHHCAYLDYVSFNLSESEVCYLNLPKEEPLRAVACTWRVVLTAVDENGSKCGQISISPTALAACLRIDSYFNKSLVPNITATLSISRIDLSLYTSFDKTASVLPDSLKDYMSDLAVPESHCFFKLSCESLQMHLASWNMTMVALDAHFFTRCSVLDYTYLTERTLLNRFFSKIEVNWSKELHCTLISNQIQVMLSPTITHTLAVNSQMWAQNLNINNEQRNFIVFTKYVVCNDTNVSLRFGQADTDEDLLLSSRCFHMYCWRSHKSKRKFKVALEERGWIWSKPFRVDFDGTFVVSVSSENNTSLIVTVKSLSATQKQVIMSGQFVMANMLLEHFEFKIVPDVKDKDKELKRSLTHVLGGKTTTPSMFLDYKTKYFMRLRFFGLESAWTGDIPLKEHTKGAQPWLVKVPLQERGQFLSIWCRIVIQDFDTGKKILAMLWPLFTVKSNLPVTSKIHIETPTLNVRLDTTVRGKGEIQQLYCPGTIDHSHKLTFKLNDDTSISNCHVPLNYSLVDQQQFFKKRDKEDIDDILSKLQQCSTTKWPYFGEELEGINWVVDDQPQTAIQVRYRNACEYSSSLLVEVVPWCLMVNTFGCPISLMANNKELCKVWQYGIVAPPKLDENFHLGIDTGSGWCYSGPLQLAKSNWSQTFYMPTISGTLPIEGGIKTAVKCGAYVCMVYLSSKLADEIRLLRIASTHVLSNYLVTQIQVVCFAVPEGVATYEIPHNLEPLSFSVAPHSDKTNSGMSIIRWYALDDKCDSNTEYVLYIAFSLQQELGWSCPIRVDKPITRKSISINSSNNSIPVVLIAQEHKGQIYLSLHHDERPQTLIDNKISIPLFCGQAAADNKVVPESDHFNCFTKVNGKSTAFYTMPFVSDKFPELPQTGFCEKIVFASGPKDSAQLEWSNSISITSDSEQFIIIPSYGDVKLITKLTAFATLLTIEPVSQVEISAIDIRGRLSLHELRVAATTSQKSDTPVYLTSNTEDNCISSDLPSQSISPSCYDSLFTSTVPMMNECESVELAVFLQSFGIVFSTDQPTDVEENLEVASFTFDGVSVKAVQQKKQLSMKLGVSDMQFDNLLYSMDSFDFPVVFVGQETTPKNVVNVCSIPSSQLFNDDRKCLVFVELNAETWKDNLRNISFTGVKEFTMTINPLSCYIEELYISRLSDYFRTLLPTRLSTNSKITINNGGTTLVKVPEEACWQSQLIARPLNFKNISIEPLSLLLSVHCSLKMYIALDQSPLQFGRFTRQRILTTAYRLGHAMTMHYLSGAIFGAGWVVSSLELLGSPGGLARAMGSGLRDFINMPYRGLVQGPWAFLIGVTHGSASLMRHLTAGTLQSITKLASSVARNLDRLTMDEEHLRRTEEQRRRKPQGVTQGFIQGLTGLGISLLGAVGGIAHHPLQSIMSDTASPRSLVAGVGLGLVGVFTKPLSGAAELVALTGQGLLQGAGWNPLPQPRFKSVCPPPPHDTSRDSSLKYEWRLLNSLSCKKLLCVTEATAVNKFTYTRVTLVLTSDALIIVNTEDDTLHRILSLSQVHVSKDLDDPTLILCKMVVPLAPSVKTEDELTVEMDPACRARVADYVRTTAGLLQIPEDNVQESDTDAASLPEHVECSEILHFHVNPLIRNYFVGLSAVAKQQSHSNCNFAVL